MNANRTMRANRRWAGRHRSHTLTSSEMLAGIGSYSLRAHGPDERKKIYKGDGVGPQLSLIPALLDTNTDFGRRLLL